MRRKAEKNNLWENLDGFRYAHRGLFQQPRTSLKKSEEYRKRSMAKWKASGKAIIPENSMEAFRKAVRRGFGSEMDVHLTADGKLVVFHDENILRMTGVDRLIEEMTWDEISQVRLLGTGYGIPRLEEVLDLFTSEEALTGRTDARAVSQASVDVDVGPAPAGRSALHLPLIIELKAVENVPALCSAVMEMIDRYPTLNYCLESFDPRAVRWLRRSRPDVIRGQLTENFMKSRDAVKDWGYVMTFGMWSVAPNLITRPDFIACKFQDRRNVFIRLSHRFGVRQVSWTIKNSDDLLTVEREGGIGIFEGFVPEGNNS